MPSRRPGGGDLRVDYADRCTLTAHGSLRIAGRGARASTIDVSEDLFAVAPGSTIQSCTVRVGGVMRAVELASTEDAALRIEFPEPRPLPDLLRADVVHPGVQVIVGGQLLSFDRRQDNVQVGIEAGQITRTSH